MKGQHVSKKTQRRLTRQSTRSYYDRPVTELMEAAQSGDIGAAKFLRSLGAWWLPGKELK